MELAAARAGRGADRIFDKKTAWSRAWKSKPLHTLRKEFGSVVCDLHGIYAASLALGHAHIGITARYYLDKKGRTTVGMGHLLMTAWCTSPGCFEINFVRAYAGGHRIRPPEQDPPAFP